MQPRSRVAMFVAAAAVVGSCSANSPTDPAATDSSNTSVLVSPTTTEVGPAGSPPFVPLAAPARIEPITGRWIQSDLGLDELLVIPRGLIWDETHFYLLQRVAFGDMRVWRSVDALAWEELPRLGTLSMEDGGPYALLSHGDRLVAGGRRGEEATVWLYEGVSPWREVSLGGEAWITSLAVAGPNLVAFGSTVSPGPKPERHARLWVSRDGVSWTEIDDTQFGEFSRAVGVVPFEDGVLAVANRSSTGEGGRIGREAPLLLTSKDGVAWERLDVDLGEVELMKVTGGDEIRLHTRSSVFQSDDGASWTELLTDRSGIAGEETLDAVSWFKGHAVAIGGTLRDDERFGEVHYPAAWTYIGDGDWLELGSLDGFTNPGFIGAGIPGGDRFVANGREATDGSPDDGWSLYTFVIEFPVEYVVDNWINFTGLGQLDPTVWTERLGRACTEGVWEDDVANRLADEFIAEDLPLSARADGAAPSTAEAAQALWLMAVNYCRADFPAGQIADGVPTP